MKGAFKFAVVGEGLTGLALLILPNMVGRLLPWGWSSPALPSRPLV